MSWWEKLRHRSNEEQAADDDADSGIPQQQGVDADDPSSAAAPVPLHVTDVLDLHSFSPREVREVVRTYLDEARAKGFSTVRIIHGKGIGTQRAMVRGILEKTDFVESYQDAPGEAGGWGATVVWFSAPRL